MRIRIESFDDLPLEKAFLLYNVVILVRSTFKEERSSSPPLVTGNCGFKPEDAIA